MTILASDIKLRASVVMADVPEGGGGPSGTVINWGDSNTIFGDVDSVSRTMGNVSIRQLHSHTDTDSTERLLGSYAIVAKVPDDEKVNVTLAQCAPFDRRTQIQTAIADYLIRGTQWGGVLLENHVKGQRNIQIFQRVGARKPIIGRTLVLVLSEDTPQEQLQYVRVIKVEEEERTFTDERGQDYQANVVTCELQSPLSWAFPGTGPNRQFATGSNKTVLRDTTEADAANYYGTAELTVAAEINDLTLKAASAYAQLVPSSQTQVPALDQRPAARSTIELADSPREVEVAVTPHTYRIKIGQENRGLSYVAQATPPPEPGTLTITWVGLGNTYHLRDNGSGELSGDGAGTVNSSTGSIAISLPSLPDVGSAIVYQWGTRQAYTNRSSQGASVRLPEFAFTLDGEESDGTGKDQVVPASLSLEYTSDSTVYTVTDDGAGNLTGDGTGRIDYYSRAIFLRPTRFPDAGATFSIDYDLDPVVEQIISSPGSPDGGGFVAFALADEPAAGSVQIKWAVARQVSATGGAKDTRSQARDTTGVKYDIRTVPEYYVPAATTGGSVTGSTTVTYPPPVVASRGD